MAGAGMRIAQNVGKSVLSHNSSRFLRRGQRNLFVSYRACNSKTTQAETERDPAPLFFNHEVQQLLKTLTRVDMKKVFRRRLDNQKLEAPVYKFMTDEELKQAIAASEEKAKLRLQMPPVVKKRNEVKQVIRKDEALQGYDTSKFVFTDITFGVSNHDRSVVVREPDGTLRRGTWDERQRMNQIYFPLPGRELRTPRMFQEENLVQLLDQEAYEFILDRACIQFEPNDPEYHRVTEEVYSYINKRKQFDALRSTRHYGPLTFYLAWNKNIDNLLLENIETKRINDAALLIQLYHKLHPTAESADVEYDGDDIKFVDNYIKHLPKNSHIQLAINAYKEFENERKAVEEGIKQAHGQK